MSSGLKLLREDARCAELPTLTHLRRCVEYLAVFGILVFALCAPAFGDTLTTTTDPVGFCPPPATVPACTTGTGLTKETIAVGPTTFGMEKNGSGTSVSPWYLLLAVPNDVGGAPTITSVGGVFTLAAGPVDKGEFLPTTAGSIYTFAGVTGDSSMNAANLFCDGSYPCKTSNEINAFGSLPTFFEIFEYTFTPAFGSFVPYTFTTSGLTDGTFLAASGGSNPFSTPFTVTGLVTPEPSTMLLFGGGLLGLAALMRRKYRHA